MAKRFKWYGKRLVKEVDRKADKGLEFMAIKVADEAKLLLKAPKSGKFYSGNKRRSAAPGEPPAVQDGELRRRTAYEKVRALVWRVGTNLLYGFWQEFGTSKMPAHPWLRPALEKRRQARDFERYMKGKI